MNNGKKKYKDIFFDLDRTLWDFDRNSEDALNDIIIKYDLLQKGGTAENFINLYKEHNHYLWDLYREKKLSKRILRWKRFYLTLKDIDIENEDLSKIIGEDYLKISSTKKILFPYTHDILEYLFNKYRLHIITNGFEEVQFTKLKNCDLDKYFIKVITSERVGAHKPKPDIFLYALKEAGAVVERSIMIGDDYKVDIEGARNVGMDQIFFNTGNPESFSKYYPTFQVSSLLGIKDFL